MKPVLALHKTEFAIIIDLDEYAGNCERDLCAYITGLYGDCGYAEEIAAIAEQELGTDFEWFKENVIATADEDGTWRPVALEPSPGLLHDGFGNTYSADDDPAEIKKLYLESLEKHHGERIKQYETNGQTESVEAEKRALAKAKRKGPGLEPVYNSIIIYLDERPPKNIREIVRERAKEYATNPEKYDKFSEPFKIKKIRFVKRITKIINKEI